MSNYKKSIFSLLVIFLFLGLTQSVFALELDYPNFGFGGGLGAFFDLPTYIVYVFQFLIISAGTIGIISIVISGFRILLSFGKPEAISAARGNIISVVLGIVLLMTSFIILRTINPELVNIVSTTEPPHKGVYLISTAGGGFRYIQAPKSVPYASGIPLLPPVQLYYFCPPGTTGRNLLVWKYGVPNFGINNTETTVSKACNTFEPIDSAGSFTHEFEDEGIYFYTTPDCTGYSSNVQKVKGRIIFPRLTEIKSLKIISGWEKRKRYGVILNKKPDGSGECSEPILKADQGPVCIGPPTFPFPTNLIASPPIPPNTVGIRGLFNPTYAHILKIEKIDPGAPSFPADYGIKFFSKNLVAKLKQSGNPNAPFNIGQMFLYRPWPQTIDVNNIIKDLLGIQYPWSDFFAPPPPLLECCTKDTSPYMHPECKTEPDCVSGCAVQSDPNAPCLKKIVFEGSYYVFIYSKEDASKQIGCTVFDTDYDNIKAHTNLFDEFKTLYNIAVIPKHSE